MFSIPVIEHQAKSVRMKISTYSDHNQEIIFPITKHWQINDSCLRHWTLIHREFGCPTPEIISLGTHSLWWLISGWEISWGILKDYSMHSGPHTFGISSYKMLEWYHIYHDYFMAGERNSISTTYKQKTKQNKCIGSCYPGKAKSRS